MVEDESEIDSHVHGDIRHLETLDRSHDYCAYVHGDIRHLEIRGIHQGYLVQVHGDIRHLESTFLICA